MSPGDGGGHYHLRPVPRVPCLQERGRSLSLKTWAKGLISPGAGGGHYHLRPGPRVPCLQERWEVIIT
jgi:hypothetical protein